MKRVQPGNTLRDDGLEDAYSLAAIVSSPAAPVSSPAAAVSSPAAAGHQPGEHDSFVMRTLVDGGVGVEDSFQVSLRPTRLDDYVGQHAIRKNLRIAIAATRKRGEPLDHVLFHGPPGLGKTTLAAIIAHELGSYLRATSGPVLERPGDLAAILSSLSRGDVLFIDEIHRLPRVVEEILYPAMEDYRIDIILGQGPAARSIKLEIQPFTLVGATTRTGMLTGPFRDRFGIVERLDFYEPAELCEIIKRSARLLEIPITEDGALQVASRSRGTPRIANRLLKRARDFAQECADGTITVDVANEALSLLSVDSLGLDKIDRLLLTTIIDKFGGGPVGIETLAAAMNDVKDTLEDVYEPFLMQQGFLRRTPRGREATVRAYQHLGRTPPTSLVEGSGVLSSQKSLFPTES